MAFVRIRRGVFIFVFLTFSQQQIDLSLFNFEWGSFYMMKKIGLIFCFVLIVTFQEISSLSVEPCEGETLIVTVFEIQRSEVNKNFQLLVLNLNLECKQEQMNDFTILNINSICCFTRSDSIFYQEGA